MVINGDPDVWHVVLRATLLLTFLHRASLFVPPYTQRTASCSFDLSCFANSRTYSWRSPSCCVEMSRHSAAARRRGPRRSAVVSNWKVIPAPAAGTVWCSLAALIHCSAAVVRDAPVGSDGSSRAVTRGLTARTQGRRRQTGWPAERFGEGRGGVERLFRTLV